jgi:hypothetical protein
MRGMKVFCGSLGRGIIDLFVGRVGGIREPRGRQALTEVVNGLRRPHDNGWQRSDHDLRPEGRRPIRHRIQDGRRRGDGDLNPENLGRSDPALSRADALRTVRAGGASAKMSPAEARVALNSPLPLAKADGAAIKAVGVHN